MALDLAAAGDLAAARFLPSSAGARPRVLGLCGVQGAGKTTLAAALEAACQRRGARAQTLALDDFYLSRNARAALARRVHPLCATRGVPGTHDIGALARAIVALRDGRPGTGVGVPVFSKLDDDIKRDKGGAPVRRRLEAGPDLIIVEGWCVGARALDPASLMARPNALEARDDPDGAWRRWWNSVLSARYEPVWRLLDALMLVTLAGMTGRKTGSGDAMAAVVRARLHQEQRLAAREGRAMRLDRAGVAAFVAHYQRLTEHMLREIPKHADLVLARDDSFSFEVLEPA